MENVTGAIGHPEIPKEWNLVVLNDWDCGGETERTRAFWLWPMMMLALGQRSGRGRHSVMASTYKRGSSSSTYCADKGFLAGDLPIEEYGRLQGAPELAAALRDHKAKPSRSFIVHMLGNGVPLSMGRAISQRVKEAISR